MLYATRRMPMAGRPRVDWIRHEEPYGGGCVPKGYRCGLPVGSGETRLALLIRNFPSDHP